MVQSDALSWRPDLCPEEDNDNEDIVMLPDELFVSLIDTDLQERIAMADNLDGNAVEALRLLLESAPHSNDNRLGGLDIGRSEWTKCSFLQRKELHTTRH